MDGDHVKADTVINDGSVLALFMLAGWVSPPAVFENRTTWVHKMSETRSDSLRREIQELTGKVRELRLELEELVRRPRERTEWRMMSSHGERSVAHERGERPPPREAQQRDAPPDAAQPPGRSRPARAKKK
jgi:hypothetical protein